jgi:hypothetical protein
MPCFDKIQLPFKTKQKSLFVSFYYLFFLIDFTFKTISCGREANQNVTQHFSNSNNTNTYYINLVIVNCQNRKLRYSSGIHYYISSLANDNQQSEQSLTKLYHLASRNKKQLFNFIAPNRK